MKTKRLGLLIFILLFGTLMCFLLGNKAYAATTGAKISVNNPAKTVQKTKVLVIEINPVLKTVTDNSLYKNNNGHPKVSEFFGQDEEAALNEFVKDIEDSSHGYIKISLKREWLNEFPTYKESVKLSNGKSAYRFNEKTYLKYAGYTGGSVGSWHNLVYSTIYDDIKEYSFDYEYLIKKFDLVNRKNKGEFDQVWLLSIDPSSTYETMMVGRSAFWINGMPIEKDCENFLLANVSISRRDANFHALGHAAENIMNVLYGKSRAFEENGLSINSKEEYNKLNLWEKFSLNSYGNKYEYGSVGVVHFPFNGVNDYDYENTNTVYTNWQEWLNYPNISGDFVLDNNIAWLIYGGNNRNLEGDRSANRLYTRFWFSLMPHITGYTSDGYLNNWWKYFSSLDYVNDIQSNVGTTIDIRLDEYVKVDYTLNYNSGKKDNITLVKKGDNVHIGDTKILTYKSGYVYAKKLGTSKLTIYHDGKSITYTVNVVAGAKKTFKVTYKKGSAASIAKTSLSCQTVGKYCSIKMPTITPRNHFEVIGWSKTKGSKTAEYLPGKTYKISSNMTLYAITKYLPLKKYVVTFKKNTASAISKVKATCNTRGTSCEVKMPTITPKDNYEVIGWSTNKKATVAEYLPGNSYEFSSNVTLYAITKKQ